MKKHYCCAALVLLTSSMSLYGLGLGHMRINSALDQPFSAEIDLVDIPSTNLTGLRVAVADPANYNYLGLQSAAVLSLFVFDIEKNAVGTYVIKIKSVERIAEPYIDLVVDLAWKGGQLYKAYNILLDPPGYQLQSPVVRGGKTHYKQLEPGVIDKPISSSVSRLSMDLNDDKKKSTYGPTLASENIWQLAQRYKSSTVTLSQVVLAIVGSNPDGFVQGNLNGLKSGVRLKIPATTQIQQVPAAAAEEEIRAHDLVWQKKTAINHVITPPYIAVSSDQARTKVPDSKIPMFPALTLNTLNTEGVTPQLIIKDSLVPIGGLAQQTKRNKTNNTSIIAEAPIDKAAIDSLSESNALLKQQLRLIQAQNKQLQKHLNQRDKEMAIIQEQIEVMMKQRIGIAGQISSPLSQGHSSSYWPWVLLLLITAGGGGWAYRYFNRPDEEDKVEFVLDSSPIELAVTEEQAATIEPDVEAVVIEQSQAEVELEQSIIPQEEKSVHTDDSLSAKEPEKPDVLEFESGLHESIEEKAGESVGIDKKEQEIADEQSIDFLSPIALTDDSDKPDSGVQADLTNETSDPLKSKEAFDTLLDLARTYISMGDLESAKQALEEVQEHGTELQKTEASSLLLPLQDRNN